MYRTCTKICKSRTKMYEIRKKKYENLYKNTLKPDKFIQKLYKNLHNPVQNIKSY